MNHSNPKDLRDPSSSLSTPRSDIFEYSKGELRRHLYGLDQSMQDEELDQLRVVIWDLRDDVE